MWDCCLDFLPVVGSFVQSKLNRLNSLETIATYSERRINGRRQFSLFPHEILVVGHRFFGASYEVRIPLKSTEPTVSRIFVRSTFFLIGLVLAASNTFICILLKSLLLPWSFLILFIATGILGLILAGITFKRVEFAQFRSQAGVVVFDVARSGPERHKFDEFVETLIRQIQTLKAA